MKTREELNALKEEVETLRRKLAALTEEELAQVNGGLIPQYPPCAFSEDGKVFNGIFDDNSKTVPLNIGLGPEEYDCSGLVD